MEQALATAVPLAVTAGPLDRLVAMPAGAKMKLGAGLAGLVAVIVAIGLWSSQGDYGVLFANLSTSGALPKYRQVQCPREYLQERTAFDLRLMPYIDPDLLVKARARAW